MVPLETVRGVYEKLSREAVEEQQTRRHSQHEHSQTSAADVVKNGYHSDAGDAGSADDDVISGQRSVIERTAAAAMNGRATSAPATPVHRPPPPGIERDVTDGYVTDRDVTDDELPQRGLTQTLVAQWRELEERAKAERRIAATRSRSLSGLALRRAESASPGRRAEQGRSSDVDDGNELIHDDVDEHGRSSVVSQQKTGDVAGQTGVVEEHQLPPPLMTQYMLAKFRDMEAETRVAAGLQAKDRKVG